MPLSWEALKQRKLVQWGVAYLAGAWLLLQVLSLLAQPFAWPNLVLRAAAVVLGVGFFAVLVVAWYHGEKGEQRMNGMELLMLAGILVVAGVGVSLVAPGSPPLRAEAPAPARTPDRRSIAVLPFDNLSDEKGNGYLATGIQDEILTNLAQLADLKVISRTSVLQYADTKKSIKQIAGELGVGVVLEGTVQRAGNRIRVQAQLIDAKTEEHLWAQHYDRDLTDVFAIQSDIAQQIAGALQARLTAGALASIATRPTQNAGAYDFYLRAREYDLRPYLAPEDYEAAERLYLRAVALDPDFALAHARLSRVYARMRWVQLGLRDSISIRQRMEAERALRLQPALTEGHVAMAYSYQQSGDLDRALQELTIAGRSAPNDAEIQLAVASVHRGQGKFEQALAELEKAQMLDPRNVLALRSLGSYYLVMHRFREAVRTLDRVLELAPYNYDVSSLRGSVYLEWTGTVDTLAAVVVHFPKGESTGSSADFDRFEVARLRRDHTAELRAAQRAPEVMVHRYYVPRALLLARALQDQGDGAGARRAFEEARVIADAAVRASPDDPRPRIALGYALAGLGRRSEAAASGRRATLLAPSSSEPHKALFSAQEYAAILAQAGETDRALAEIQRLLPGPGLLTVNLLKLDPIWDPLRTDPRFQRLLRTKE
jgi:TolB-like protein/Flp pilus assembly protein TadD